MHYALAIGNGNNGTNTLEIILNAQEMAYMRYASSRSEAYA